MITLILAPTNLAEPSSEVGAKVTIEYSMTAKSIEVKPAAAVKGKTK